MKYRRIYQTLERHNAKISYDGSGWRYADRFQTFIQRTRPLWIVAEAPNCGLRLWICRDSGRLSVTTADMTLSIDHSQTRRDFRTQGEMADYLETLLEGFPSAAS